MNQFYEKMKDVYTVEHLNQIEFIESQLVFDSFDNNDALTLGTLLTKLASEEFGDIAIIITRESDGLITFQHVMNSKSQKNLDYACMKRKAVIATGHNSLWVLIKGLVDEPSLLENTEYIPVGGAFPIYVGEELVATVAISGLKDGKDYILLEKGIASYLGKEIDSFKGYLI